MTIRDVSGGRVAFQSGIPVPSFDFQPRARLQLDGKWHADLTFLDRGLSLSARTARTRAALEREAAGRLQDAYDDSHWRLLDVPGAWNAPPNGLGAPTGAWYRRHFTLPSTWAGQAVTLKFASINYLADVWLNGSYLGYHEGGSTPFAFDATDAVALGGLDNTLIVRVDVPPLGSRNDIVPWGLTDWWNYAGITGSVWLEASNPVYVARSDITPHLDGADVSAVVQNSSQADEDVFVRFEVLAAGITSGNLTNPDPRSLLVPGAPLAVEDVAAGTIARGDTARVSGNFTINAADLWTPAAPALYVLRTSLFAGPQLLDQTYESFGLRTISVARGKPQLLLNGTPVSFSGVSAHLERVAPPLHGQPRGGIALTPNEELALLGRAEAAGADLVRTDHHPPDPLLLQLADRLGFAVWEEIPLYHYTPETFNIAMSRGVPQQMLAEMVLRDLNHPSVLFHGLANESTGGAERASALSQLRDVDRELDGTRLTGQAAYGFDVRDTSSSPLDVAGFTFYYGVFYGQSTAATEKALEDVHARYPDKPIMILEFGRWSDAPNQDALQRSILTETYPILERHSDTASDGYVGAAVWWTLDDYWTIRPGIRVEHFGLYRPDGSARPAGLAASGIFGRTAGKGPRLAIVSHGRAVPASRLPSSLILLSVLAYAVFASIVLVAVAAGLIVILAQVPKWKPQKVAAAPR